MDRLGNTSDVTSDIASSNSMSLTASSAVPQRSSGEKAQSIGRHTIPTLKLFGERNTGTNYLAQLLERNLFVTQLRGVVPSYIERMQNQLHVQEALKDAYFLFSQRSNLGWKHAAAPHGRLRQAIGRRSIFCIFAVKNPYSWLLSMYKRPYHRRGEKAGSFEEFLEKPWRTLRREGVDGALLNPVNLWNVKNRSYIESCERIPGLLIRYEELLADPHRVVSRVAEFSHARWRYDGFCNQDDSTKEVGKRFDDYRRYYLEEVWKIKLSPQAVSLINERLDEEVLRQLKYVRL